MIVALTEGEPRLRRATEDPFRAALFIDGTQLRRGAELKGAEDGQSGVAAVGFNCVTRAPGLLADEMAHLAREIEAAGWQVLVTHRGPGGASSTQVVHHFGGHGEVHEERWILVGRSESGATGRPALAEVVCGRLKAEYAARSFKFGVDEGGAVAQVRTNASVRTAIEELCERADRGAVLEVHSRLHRMVRDLTRSGSEQLDGEVISLCPQAGFEEVEEVVRLSWARSQTWWRPTLCQWVRRCAEAQREDLRFQLGARLWGAETSGYEERWESAESLAEVVAALAG